MRSYLIWWLRLDGRGGQMWVAGRSFPKSQLTEKFTYSTLHLNGSTRLSEEGAGVGLSRTVCVNGDTEPDLG